MHVLITGGTSGLGKAIAEELAQGPFKVSILGRNKEKIAQFSEKNIHTIHGDATDEQLVNKVVRDLKPQIFILNAGATQQRTSHRRSPPHMQHLRV